MRIDLKKIIELLFFIAIFMYLLLMFSCSKNYHLKRSQHHLEKAISKGYELEYDTTFINDTVRLESVRTDTLIKDIGDTVILKKDRLKVIYKRDTMTNEVYISGECEADTIIREIPVKVQKPIYIKQTPLEWAGIDKWWEKLLFLLSVIVIVALIIVKVFKLF